MVVCRYAEKAGNSLQQKALSARIFRLCRRCRQCTVEYSAVTAGAKGGV